MPWAWSTPATTPVLLARYLVVRADEPLVVNRDASAELIYVFQGEGVSDGCGESVEWGTGDVFCFPGGTQGAAHGRRATRCCSRVANDPLLQLERLRPAMPDDALVRPVHWSHEAIEKQFEVVFSTAGHRGDRRHRGPAHQRADGACRIPGADHERRHQHP